MRKPLVAAVLLLIAIIVGRMGLGEIFDHDDGPRTPSGAAAVVVHQR